MLKFENPINGRFYYIELTRDIFNDRVISIFFGGRGVSRNTLVYCRDGDESKKLLQKLIKRRYTRGYILIYD